jgi:hypothetical protein
MIVRIDGVKINLLRKGADATSGTRHLHYLHFLENQLATFPQLEQGMRQYNGSWLLWMRTVKRELIIPYRYKLYILLYLLEMRPLRRKA